MSDLRVLQINSEEVQFGKVVPVQIIEVLSTKVARRIISLSQRSPDPY